MNRRDFILASSAAALLPILPAMAGEETHIGVDLGNGDETVWFAGDAVTGERWTSFDGKEWISGSARFKSRHGVRMRFIDGKSIIVPLATA